MPYQLNISHRAEKELKKLPRPIALEIDKAILGLADNPRPKGYKKLRGYTGTYPIKVSNYRILYLIEGKQLIIEVIRIAGRKDAYKA